MYIDLSSDEGGRICLNAKQADILTCGDVGATNKPVYFVGGEPQQCLTYAGGTRINLNGTTKGSTTVTVWTPSSAGTAGQLLVSTGAAPAWSSTTYSETKKSTGRTTAGTITSLGLYGQTYGNDAAYLAASGKLSYGDPGPQINFSASTTSAQKGAIIFTDHDTIGTGASFSFVSTESNTWLIAPTIKALTKFIGTLQGNATTASALETKRKISLTGDVSGSVDFDGSADISITATVADDSHNHIIGNIDGLQDALNNRMSIKPYCIELNSDGGLKSYGGFIDFHFHNSEGKPLNSAGTVVTATPDYTSRIIESSAGTLSINGATFKGGVMTGSLNGNAKTATALETAVQINGTTFDGTKNITTAQWGTTRKISISSTAGTTGTNTNGSADITLKIPSTLTGFSSIASSNFRGIVRRTFERDTSNAIHGITWYDANDTTLHQYIMGHNTSNAIIINPKYDTTKDAWSSAYGLYVSDSQMKFNNSAVLNASNYTDYTVKKDGTGATGTWRISITGNAATATTATTANKVANALSINGKSYNGSSAINVGTIGIGYGGTGATTAIKARVNLIALPNNPITKVADDTVAKWGAYGPGATAFYSATGQLTDQPSQWGFVQNIMTTTGTELHQIWATQASGDMYHRGGNASGWSGTWRKFLDSTNYNTYSPTLTGGGASGTWGISITGNAATATKATQDGAGNVITSKYVTLDTAQTISGTKTMTAGLNVSGRCAGGGDDEGIVVGFANNGYAGLCLGRPSQARSVFYFKSDGSRPFWRYNNGTTNYDIHHPSKSGTIALTSDLANYLPLSGGTMSGALNFANGTWNNVGDDCALGDYNQAGVIGIKGLNGATGIYFVPYSGSVAQKITIDGAGTMSITGKVSTETLQTVSNGVTSTIGSQNNGWLHYNTNSPSGHWFNKNVSVQGNIYAGTNYSDLVLTSANYTSYAPTKTGSGASGTWGINITGSAGSLTSNAGSSTKAIYFTGGKPAQCGDSLNHNARGVYASGYGNGNFTWNQTSASFAGSTWSNGWASYLISNHGDGSSYYNQIIALPFWGPPAYRRLEGGTAKGWYDFITDENSQNKSVGYMQTWQTDKSKTYGTQYPLYAWWETGSICKLTVDNYTTKVDQAVALTTDAGSSTQPVYFSGGKPIACTAYSGLLTAFSSSTNTLSITVGGTTKTATAVNSVSNAWEAGTSAGPKIKTTVNGKTGTAVAIPKATESASGVVTTGTQTFAGAKTFNSYINVGNYVKSTSARGGMWISGTHDASFVASVATTASAGSFYQGWYSGKTQAGAWSMGALSGSEDLCFVYGTDANYKANINTTVQATRISASTGRLFGAAWNDYAEYRVCQEDYKPGQVVCENGDDTLSIATRRLQPGANVVSDTFGFAIGETELAKCPIAVSGRVLVYTYEPREEFKPGEAVCAGPNGTVSRMTREEIREYPECIIGTVSAVPTYETWGQTDVPVDGRIWIKIK